MNDAQIDEILRAGGAAAILDASKATTEKEKIAFLKHAIRKITFGSWPNSYLEDMIQLGDEAIAHALSINEVDEANMVCFNMSSNLCDCWADGFQRQPRHFEKGLAYADRALEFRRLLGKSPDRVAMAHWARGKHLLSLARFDDAVGAFNESLNCIVAADNPEELATLLSAKAYLGLAQHAASDPQGAARFDEALAALSTLKGIDEKRSAEIQMYLDQLNVTKALLSKT